MRRRGSGMTLVELVVALGLFGVVMVTLFPAFLLSNLIDNTAKEFSDGNAIAQQAMENAYQLSKTLTLDDATNALEGTFSYVCTPDASTMVTLYTCSRTNGNFLTVLTLTRNQPRADVTDAVVNVTTINGEEAGNRASLELYIRFSTP